MMLTTSFRFSLLSADGFLFIDDANCNCVTFHAYIAVDNVLPGVVL